MILYQEICFCYGMLGISVLTYLAVDRIILTRFQMRTDA